MFCVKKIWSNKRPKQRTYFAYHPMQNANKRLRERRRKSLAAADALVNWNTSHATPCAWTGVKCDDTGAVTEVSLPNLNLVGSFPADVLCRLPRLRFVDLSTNYIGPDLDRLSTYLCIQLVICVGK